jgi:hypothetical protein
MARYTMDDGTVVDTKNATESWDEDTRWDGSNHVSVATGSQWEHETLYRSAKGRYWVQRTSQRDGTLPSASWRTPEEAARWLLANDHDLPEDLAHLKREVSE